MWSCLNYYVIFKYNLFLGFFQSICSVHIIIIMFQPSAQTKISPRLNLVTYPKNDIAHCVSSHIFSLTAVWFWSGNTTTDIFQPIFPSHKWVVFVQLLLRPRFFPGQGVWDLMMPVNLWPVEPSVECLKARSLELSSPLSEAFTVPLAYCKFIPHLSMVSCGSGINLQTAAQDSLVW